MPYKEDGHSQHNREQTMENADGPGCCSLCCLVWPSALLSKPHIHEEISLFGHGRGPAVCRGYRGYPSRDPIYCRFSGVPLPADWLPFAAAGPPRPFARCLLQLRKRIRQVFQCPGQRFPSTVCFRRAITLIWKRKFSDARIYAIGITASSQRPGGATAGAVGPSGGDGAGSHNHAAFLVRLWL